MTLTIDETTDCLVNGRICAYDSNGFGEFEFPGTYTGTLPTGIEARAFNRNDNDSTVLVNGNTWNQLSGQVIGDGNIYGRLGNIPTINGMYGFELRKVNDPADSVLTVNSIGVGFVIAGCGQSHIDEWANSQIQSETPSTLTRMAHWSTNGILDSALGHYTGYAEPIGYGVVRFCNLLQSALECPILFLDYGCGGSALMEVNDSGFSWWVDTGNTHTDTENRFNNIYNDRLIFEPLDRIKLNAVIWMQGHSDADGYGDGWENYKTVCEVLFSWFRDNTYFNNPDCKIYISGIGSTDWIDPIKASDIREVEVELAQEQVNSIYACTQLDLPTRDFMGHLSNTGQLTQAERIYYSVLQNRRGPIPYAYYLDVANSYTYIYLSLDTVNGASDITPIDSIDSFDFYYNDSWNNLLGTKIDEITIRFSTGVNTNNITDVRCLYGNSPNIVSIIYDNNSLPIEPRLSIPEGSEVLLGWSIDDNDSNSAVCGGRPNAYFQPAIGNEPSLTNGEDYTFTINIKSHSGGASERLFLKGFCAQTEITGANTVGESSITVTCTDQTAPVRVITDATEGWTGEVEAESLELVT